MVIYSGFSHWKWWFSIVMLVYQRVFGDSIPDFPGNESKQLETLTKLWIPQSQPEIVQHRLTCFLCSYALQTSGPHIWGIYIRMPMAKFTPIPCRPISRPSLPVFGWHIFLGEFRDLLMILFLRNLMRNRFMKELPTIYKAYCSSLCLREYPHKIWPNIWY